MGEGNSGATGATEATEATGDNWAWALGGLVAGAAAATAIAFARHR